MNVLVIGANSAVAKAFMLQLLKNTEATVYALVRNEAAFTHWLRAKRLHHRVHVAVADASDNSALKSALMQLLSLQKHFDRVLIAHGLLPVQLDCEANIQALETSFSVNALSVMHCLNILLQTPIAKPCKIMVITSVAGERGRPRNFAYGAAKASLGVYLQGLRSVYYKTGWEFYEIKLGPVDSPMTINHEKNFSFSNPEKVAQIMLKTFGTKRYQRFVPGFWFWVMLAVKFMPEALFQRLRFLSAR